MPTIPTTTVRIDPAIKEQANDVFEELGLSMSAAVNIFLRAVIRHRGMPFDVVIDESEENEE
ncbi:MAG: type II toxin-antitoxin system RelB/DinJ family antitoxin [Eggerthellaceae bacterium]|nr:type II toxin-antitoxin system RelB/DinJ family antitoxin [Eggerthellaceae bacterium]